MRRPADQAKLLFLALLRSSAALATRNSAAATTASAAHAAGSKGGVATAAAAAAATATVAADGNYASPIPLLDGHIALRVARRSDVPSIQQCNLATLPENYSQTFYHNHMRQWPDLALVAEHVPSSPVSPSASAYSQSQYGAANSNGTGRGQRLPSRSSAAAAVASSVSSNGIRGANGRYDPTERMGEGDNGRRIVGYVLGKVEPRHANANNGSIRSRSGFLNSLPPSTILDDDDERGLLEAMSSDLRRIQQRPEHLGHVTSLAVLKEFRRKGLAAELMEQLHFHMRHAYRADAVGLHVRVSNGAATRLYRDGMGYDVHDIIQNYYQDGEDAYFMRKDFSLDAGTANGRNGRLANGYEEYGKVSARLRRGGVGAFAFRRQSPCWETGPEEFRLPRLVADLEATKMSSASASPAAASVASTVDLECEEEDLSDVEEEAVMTGAM